MKYLEHLFYSMEIQQAGMDNGDLANKTEQLVRDKLAGNERQQFEDYLSSMEERRHVGSLAFFKAGFKAVLCIFIEAGGVDAAAISPFADEATATL